MSLKVTKFAFCDSGQAFLYKMNPSQYHALTHFKKICHTHSITYKCNTYAVPYQGSMLPGESPKYTAAAVISSRL